MGEAETKPRDKLKQPVTDVKTLARLFSLTPARVQQLVNEGVLHRESKGKYDLFDSISRYVQYLQNRKVNQWDSDEENPSDIKKEQLRRTKEEADKLELQNARTRGELVEVSTVKHLGEKVMSAVRNRILNMPLTDDEKDKCLRDVLSLRDLDFSED